MQTLFHGNQIYLRLLTPDDVTNAYVQWMQDPEVNQYLESRWDTFSIEVLRDYVRKTNDGKTNFMFGMFLNTTDRHIGNIKAGPVHPIHKYADIGLIIGDKTMWGKGIAAEAISMITDFCFQELHLHKLTAGMYEANIGSYRAFIKCGYQQAGIKKKHFLCNGHYQDFIMLEIFNTDESCD